MSIFSRRGWLFINLSFSREFFNLNSLTSSTVNMDRHQTVLFFSPVGAGIFDAFTVMSPTVDVDSFTSPSALDSLLSCLVTMNWKLFLSGNWPSGRAIHVPQISTWIYGGIWGDHPRGNFLIISLRKWRRNEGEFSMWIFPPLFPRESPRIFPHGNFPHVSLKMQSVIKGHTKGPSCKRISQWCFNVNSLVNWKVYGFRKISFSFQSGIFREMKGMVLRRNIQQISAAYNKWSMLIKPPGCHPANFIGYNR